MAKEPRDHTLEYLLGYDGLIHWLDKGYSLRFVIKKIRPTAPRPHGLRYSFTFHDGEGAESLDSTTRISRRSSELNTGRLRKLLITGIELRAIGAEHIDLSTPKRWSKTSSEKFIANSRSGAFRPMLSTSRGERIEPCQN